MRDEHCHGAHAANAYGVVSGASHLLDALDGLAGVLGAFEGGKGLKAETPKVKNIGRWCPDDDDGKVSKVLRAVLCDTHPGIQLDPAAQEPASLRSSGCNGLFHNRPHRIERHQEKKKAFPCPSVLFGAPPPPPPPFESSLLGSNSSQMLAG